MAKLFLGVMSLSMMAFAESRIEEHFLKSNISPQQEYVFSPMLAMIPGGPQEAGARFSAEMWNDGFIDTLNDSVSGEVSFFAGRWVGYKGVSTYASVNMRWDFHLVPEWTVFASPGIAVRRRGKNKDAAVGGSLQIGGFWNIQNDLALRADLEIEHFTPRIGLAFRY